MIIGEASLLKRHFYSFIVFFAWLGENEQRLTSTPPNGFETAGKTETTTVPMGSRGFFCFAFFRGESELLFLFC